MPTDAPACPGCGQPFSRIADHGIHFECANCRGRMLGLRPFEDLLEDGVGARLWVASEDGPTAAACPFCDQAMRQAATDAAGPEGLAVCHVCQQVWLPASASEWILSHAAPSKTAAPVVAALPSSCPNCGAPSQPDEEGRCRYCHTQISAPAPVVVQFEAPTSAIQTGNRFIDTLSALLDRPV